MRVGASGLLHRTLQVSEFYPDQDKHSSVPHTIMERTPSDIASFAQHFFSDREVDAAVDEFLAQRGLRLSDFARMTEREFACIVDDSENELDFMKGFTHSRAVSGLIRRLGKHGIDFLPNQSVYLRSELRATGSRSAVHRVLVRKDGSLRPLCWQLRFPATKSIVGFGDLSRRRLCSLCASFDLNSAWHML